MTRRVGAWLLATTLLCGVLTAADLPRPAGQIEFVSLEGRPIKLTELRGKVVLIEFVLTHCAACKAKARLMARLQQEYGPRGLQVLGLAIDAGAGLKLKSFADETGANFPLGIYGDMAARNYLQIPPMLNMLVPQLVAIDRRGVIRDQHSAIESWMAEKVVERNLRALIEKLLAERASPATASRKKKG